MILLPPDLAARAGCSAVEVREDDIGYAVYSADTGERLACLTCREEATLIDEHLAQVESAKPRTKRSRVKREDDRERAPEGARFEDV